MDFLRHESLAAVFQYSSLLIRNYTLLRVKIYIPKGLKGLPRIANSLE